MNADTDPNLMIPRTAYRELKAVADSYREAIDKALDELMVGDHQTARALLTGALDKKENTDV